MQMVSLPLLKHCCSDVPRWDSIAATFQLLIFFFLILFSPPLRSRWFLFLQMTSLLLLKLYPNLPSPGALKLHRAVGLSLGAATRVPNATAASSSQSASAGGQRRWNIRDKTNSILSKKYIKSSDTHSRPMSRDFVQAIYFTTSRCSLTHYKVRWMDYQTGLKVSRPLDQYLHAKLS